MRTLIYTRAETNTEADRRHVAMAKWAGTEGHDVADMAWDALAGKRGLARILSRAKTGDLILVWTIADLSRHELRALVKQIQEFCATGICIRAHSTDLWIRPDTAECKAIEALAKAHHDYVSDNTKRGMEAARASGATIGRPKQFIYDERCRYVIDQMSEDGNPPSTRTLAKRIGCGTTKAAELIQQWRSNKATEAATETI